MLRLQGVALRSCLAERVLTCGFLERALGLSLSRWTPGHASRGSDARQAPWSRRLSRVPSEQCGPDHASHGPADANPTPAH